jgi:hypothetical protein
MSHSSVFKQSSSSLSCFPLIVPVAFSYYTDNCFDTHIFMTLAPSLLNVCLYCSLERQYSYSGAFHLQASDHYAWLRLRYSS